MEHSYLIYWNTGTEVLKYFRTCTYEELKQYISNCKFHNPTFTVDAVEEIFESRMRIDIDGEV